MSSERTPARDVGAVSEWRSSLKSAMSDMERELRCTICYDTYDDPHVLPCSHMFCGDCILSAISGAGESACPLCKFPVSRRQVHPLPPVRNMITAFRRLVEAVDRTAGTSLALLQHSTPLSVYDPGSVAGPTTPAQQALLRGISADKKRTVLNKLDERDIQEHGGCSFEGDESDPESQSSDDNNDAEEDMGHSSSSPPQSVAVKRRRIEDTERERRLNRKLPEACASTVQQGEALSPRTKAKRAGSIVMLGTGLSNEVKDILRKASRSIGAKIVSSFSRNVTHLIVHSIDGRSPRTLKYLRSILAGAFIVRSSWVEDSMEAGCWLDETSYEIIGDTNFGMNGPKRGRLSVQRKKPLIFEGIRIHFHGTFGVCGPTKSQSQSLAKEGGASVLGKLPPQKSNRNRPKDSKRLKEWLNSASRSETEEIDEELDQDKTRNEEASSKHQDDDGIIVIVTNSNEDISRLQSHSSVRAVVTVNWLLDSIGNYKLQTMERYVPEKEA